jgi:polyphosphate glucokinase
MPARTPDGADPTSTVPGDDEPATASAPARRARDAKARRRPARPEAPKAAEAATGNGAPAAAAPPTKILAIDIGGSNVKVLASGQTEPRKAPSGRGFTPAKLVEEVLDLAKDWDFEAVSIGYPGLVGDHGPRAEPGNLGPGWVGFDYAAAFNRPTRIINDAAMQALGSYDGGRMLFLGLGTGLGSALIAEKVIVTLELGHLWFEDNLTLGEALGRRGLDRLGKGRWRRAVELVATRLRDAFQADSVVLGGGNAKKLKGPPPGMRLGHNLTAFRGGFRLWGVEDVPTLPVEGNPLPTHPAPAEWRLI